MDEVSSVKLNETHCHVYVSHRKLHQTKNETLKMFPENATERCHSLFYFKFVFWFELKLKEWFRNNIDFRAPVSLILIKFYHEDKSMSFQQPFTSVKRLPIIHSVVFRLINPDQIWRVLARCKIKIGRRVDTFPFRFGSLCPEFILWLFMYSFAFW